MSSSSRRPAGRQRRSANTVTTKSGNKIKLNRSFSDRMKANKAARKQQKALYLSTLPKNRYKRLLYRMHPKRMAQYWFSREGAIMALKVTGIGIIVCFFLIIGVFAYFRKDLPQLKGIAGDKLGGSITYYDRTGKIVLWQDYDAIKRIPVTSDNISKSMKDATVAVEDKNFYHHGAFDVRGITRAGFNDLTGGSTQGGSTITQQLVKLNEKWTNNRTITRKVKELILAVELEREYSKDEILTGYLNIAPYGGVEYGVESAARDYFHTSAKDLTLAQAALLAAIPKSPAIYSPYSSPKYNPSASGDYFDKTALLNRQHYILDQMAQQGYITQAQADAAKKVDILAQIHPLTPKYQGIKAPYFVLAAKQQLEEKYGASTVQRGGWKVITTLDMTMQNEADKLVQNNLPYVENIGGDEEATVMEDVPTGQIIALVGGVDFTNPDHGQVNYAASTLIPPGSSFKPYDYAALINNSSAGAGSVLYDSMGPIMDPTTKTGYPCTDHSLPPPQGTGNCLWDDNRTFPGPETLRYALGGSRNVPAVKAMIQAGVDKTISTASDMMDPMHKPGERTYNCYQDEALTKVGPCYPSSAIGDGAYLRLDDHVNGMATLSRLGKALPRTFILKITDADGKVVDQWSQSWANAHSKQAIKPQTAYIVNDMLSDPRATYFSGPYKIQHWNGWDFALKTGTTNFQYDYLMAGYSTKYAVVSWVGYHTRNKSMGGSSDIATWNLTALMMEYAHRNLKPVNWKPPAGIQKLPAFVIANGHGQFFGAEFPSPSTDIYPPWYKPNSGATGTQVIDKVSGKLATSCTPSDAKETIGNINANAFSIDEFVSGGTKKANVVGNDNVHDCGDAPPAITLTAPATCDSSCTITATVSQGTHPLSSSTYPGTVSFTIGGKQVKSFTVSTSPSSVSFQYTPGSTGTAEVVATVTDSVLYQSSDSKSVDFTTAPPSNTGGGGTTNGQDLHLKAPDQHGTTIGLTWDSIDTATNYHVCWTVEGGGQQCDDTGDTAYTIQNAKPTKYYVVTVTAQQGDGSSITSDTVSFRQKV